MGIQIKFEESGDEYAWDGGPLIVVSNHGVETDVIEVLKPTLEWVQEAINSREAEVSFLERNV